MTVPCNCCPVSPDGCFEAVTQVPFQSVGNIVNPGGLSIVNLASTIDGTLGSDLSGFSGPATAAQLAANPTTSWDYVFALPVNDLVRLLWANGGGGVLTDQDGFGLVTFTFLDPANVVITQITHNMTAPAGNNAVIRTVAFPPIANVKTIRVSNFTKQNNGVMGTGSPLLRQIQAFTRTVKPVFPCRLPNGTIHFYDGTGAEVAASQVVTCESGPQ